MKVLKWIGIIVLLLLVTAVIYFLINSKDETLKDNSSLKINIKTIKDSENGFLVFKDAVIIYQNSIDKNSVNQNEAAIEKLLSAAEKSSYSIGDYSNYENLNMSSDPIIENIKFADYRSLFKLAAEK